MFPTDAPSPTEPPAASPTPSFVDERPADLDEADQARWAEMSARSGWSAMRRIVQLAPYVDEMGLAVAYTERRLEAGGMTPHEARLRTGPGLMVDALEGASPWGLSSKLLAAQQDEPG